MQIIAKVKSRKTLRTLKIKTTKMSCRGGRL